MGNGEGEYCTPESSGEHARITELEKCEMQLELEKAQMEKIIKKAANPVKMRTETTNGTISLALDSESYAEARTKVGRGIGIQIGDWTQYRQPEVREMAKQSKKVEEVLEVVE